MKKVIGLLGIVLLILFVGSNSFAATYSLYLENLPDPSEIENITFMFDVSDDFEYYADSLTLGPAAPPNQAPDTQYPWVFAYNNPVVNNGQFIVDAYNSDVNDFNETWITIPGVGTFQTSDGNYNENNLVNGLLWSFDYEGTISLSNYLIGDSTGMPISYLSLINVTERPDGLAVSQVPIPSAILLLGGGLVGLLGIRRKTMK
jgi:hypothetical protein